MKVLPSTSGALPWIKRGQSSTWFYIQEGFWRTGQHEGVRALVSDCGRGQRVVQMPASPCNHAPLPGPQERWKAVDIWRPFQRPLPREREEPSVHITACPDWSSRWSPGGICAAGRARRAAVGQGMQQTSADSALWKTEIRIVYVFFF